LIDQIDSSALLSCRWSLKLVNGQTVECK